MSNGVANGWNEWSRHVLAELERLNDQVEIVRTDIGKIQQKLAVVNTELKIKSSVWGFLGAAIPVAIMLVISYLKQS